jgi:hypothetical protein
LEQGFDYVYDKAFYDLLARREIAGLKEGLSAPVEYLEKMLRFLENHDEPRGVTSFGRFYIECAMVALSTLPGAKLWQHGQFEGRQIRVPVQLKRAPEEKIDIELKIFSENLLKQTNHPIFHEGLWELCDTYGWEDNQSHHNLLAWSWRMDEERCVVITNFYSSSAQGYVRLSSGWLPDRGEITFKDPIKGNNFLRSSSEVIRSGLYVELGAGDFHFFWVERV